MPQSKSPAGDDIRTGSGRMMQLGKTPVQVFFTAAELKIIDAHGQSLGIRRATYVKLAALRTAIEDKDTIFVPIIIDGPQSSGTISEVEKLKPDEMKKHKRKLNFRKAGKQ